MASKSEIYKKMSEIVDLIESDVEEANVETAQVAERASDPPSNMRRMLMGMDEPDTEEVIVVVVEPGEGIGIDQDGFEDPPRDGIEIEFEGDENE